MVELVIAVILALVISFGCSLTEAVFYSVPMRHIETMVQEKKPSGMILKELRGNIERPITAILSLNTIANTAGATVAGSAVTAVRGYQWVGYFSAFFTLAILIFSEVIPKTTGIVFNRKLAPFIAFPLKGLVKFMLPLIWLCGLVTGFITRKGPEDSISRDELNTMASMSLRRGVIKQYQKTSSRISCLWIP
jgi:CBS domain containing-hemolysin-like protein